MSARVDCFVGSLRRELALPDLPLKLGRHPIEAYFESAARQGSNRHLEFRMNGSRLSESNRPSREETDIPTLQRALSALFPGQPPVGLPRRVGLILGDLYEPRKTLLGLMFDVSPFSGEDHREGAAIFLNAIQALRKNEGEQAQRDEIGFTALHELGHCFNLWHAERPNFAPNFMMTSENQVFDENARSFVGRHEEYLYLADSPPDVARHVLPGGTPFDVRPNGWRQGPGGAAAIRSDPQRARRTNLQLRIQVDREEMWFFEPLELDLQLSLSGPATSRRRIPDEIDPGYERFKIWIEEPDGKRRHYCTPVRYCSNPSTLILKPGRPFRRDVTLFAGAGGYTFRAEGEHRLQVSYQAGPREVIWSNVVRLLLRPARPGLREYDEMAEVLTAPHVGRLLFYRQPASLRAPGLDGMTDLARRYSGSPTAAAIGFVVGTAAARQAGNSRNRGKPTRDALQLLEKALQHSSLGGNRRRRAVELFRAVSSRFDCPS